MKGGKGKAASVLFALGQPKGGKSEGESSGEDETDAGLESAASEVLDAVKSGDASSLATALKDFYSMC